MAMSGSAAGGDNQDMFSEGGSTEGREERERQKAENRMEAAAAVRM